MCRMSILHQKCNTAISWVRSNTPATREVDWMNSSRHNKNANRQTDAQIVLLLLERRICSAPHTEYLVLITTEASKLKKWYSAQPYWIPEVEFG